MQRDPRCRIDVFGIDAEKLLALPWLCATLVSLYRHVVRIRRLVPRLLDERIPTGSQVVILPYA
jgi:hypothetical protein